MTTKARGTGDGGLFQRGGTGRWYGVASVGWSPRVRKAKPGAEYPSSATRKRITVSGATRREAVEKLDALKAQLKSGAPRINGRTTVDEYLARWLEGVETRVRAATLRRYSGIVRHQLSPELGRIKRPSSSPKISTGCWQGSGRAASQLKPAPMFGWC
jgi:hypothetical protein